MYSGTQFINSPNWGDGVDIVVGAASYFLWEVGVVSVVTNVMISSSEPEMEQRNENIMNNKDPMEGVYNPILGM